VLALIVTRPLIVGLANGAGFGLVAIGLVLVYKSTRVFNFAAGEFVTIGAFGTYLTAGRLPFPLAMLCGVLGGLVAGLVTEFLVVRPLANRAPVTILVATAAVAILCINVELIFGGVRTYNPRPAIHDAAMHVGGVFISWQQLLIVFALLVAGALLAVFFGFTDLGLATLATSQERTAARLMGIKPNRVSMLVWGTAGALGGLAGVLLPPVTISFSPAYGTTDVLIAAFTAAVLGGMTSIPGAFLGGVLVGVVQSMAQFNLRSIEGANALAVFVVLVAVLLARPTGLLGREA
jgi:branched-chain amino acid transport system permease protein